MAEYNPRETKGIPKVCAVRIGIPKIPVTNVYGEPYREKYEIVETDEPNMLWESGATMLWEDGQNVLLENQKMRIWQQARR